MQVEDELERMSHRMTRLNAINATGAQLASLQSVYEAEEVLNSPSAPCESRIKLKRQLTVRQNGAEVEVVKVWTPGARSDELKLQFTAITSAQVCLPELKFEFKV